MEFSILRKRLKIDITRAHKLYIDNCEANFRYNSKLFWDFTKSDSRSHIFPGTMFYNGSLIRGFRVFAESFADYFHSVFSPNRPSLNIQTALNVFNAGFSDSYIVLSSFNLSQIVSSLKSLKIGNSTVPDSIPASLLKFSSTELAKPLLFIFNLSVSTGSFPLKWGKSKIVPIFKNGGHRHISNDRPISILSSIGKLFKSLIFDQLNPQINPLLDNHQLGFRPGCSSTSNLMIFPIWTFSPFQRGLLVLNLFYF